MSGSLPSALDALATRCSNCRKCSIGYPNDHTQTPHVLSNLQISKYFILGQNPGINECEQQEPFVGRAGSDFFKELSKYDLQRQDFYISNLVKCYTPKNRKPTAKERRACLDYFLQELSLLQPQIIITLGAFSFNALFPKKKYSECLGLPQIYIAPDSKNEYSVFPVLHPSPLNLCNPKNKASFENQIQMLNALLEAYKT